MRKAIKIVVIGFIGLSIIGAIAGSGGKSKSPSTQPASVAPAVTTTAPAVANSATSARTGGPAEGLAEEGAKGEANGWSGEDILTVRAAFEANAGLSGPVARCSAMNMAKTYTLEQVKNFTAAEKKTAEDQAVAPCVQNSAQEG